MAPYNPAPSVQVPRVAATDSSQSQEEADTARRLKERRLTLKNAWRKFSGSADRRTRKVLAKLPHPSPTPKRIITTR